MINKPCPPQKWGGLFHFTIMMYNVYVPKIRKFKLDNNNIYYQVISEWKYPNKSGYRDIGTSKTYDGAMELAKKVCYKERRNFCISTKEDPMFPDQFRYDNGEQGYIVTSKMGLDDWYYVARVVGVQRKRYRAV